MPDEVTLSEAEETATSDAAIDGALTNAASETADVDRALDKAKETRIRDAAKEVFRTPDYLQRMREKESDLSEALPFSEWRQRREDQLSGKTDERLADAREFGAEVRQALASLRASELTSEHGLGEQSRSRDDPQTAKDTADGRTQPVAYNERAEALRAQISAQELAKLDQTAANISLQPHVAEQIVSLQNPKVAFYLAANPQVADDLNAMRPADAAAALNSLNAQIVHTDRVFEQQKHKLDVAVTEARGRWEDFDHVAIPVASALHNDPQVHYGIKELVNESPVFIDLLYVMGSDPAEFDSFLRLARADPAAAKREVMRLENAILEERNGASEDEEGSRRASAVSKAPEPVRPVRRASPAGGDISDPGISFRDFVRLRKTQIARREG